MKHVNEADAKAVALSLVRELGLSLSTEAEAELATQVHSALRLDPDSRNVVVVDSAGNPMIRVGNDGAVVDLSPRDFVAQAAARLGAKPKTASKPQTTGMTVTDRMKAAAEGRKAELRRQAVAAASGPNPWSKTSFNLTRQGLISKHAPDLAAKLKQEASR